MAEPSKPGSIVHVEIPSKDTGRTKKFYGEVFGWKFQDVPEMKYSLFEPPGGIGGGIREPMENETGVLNYILVDSIDETTTKIEKAGGTIIQPKLEVPGQGWMAIFRDTTGTVQAIWKSAPEAEQPK